MFFSSDGRALGGPATTVVGLHCDELQVISDDTLDTSLYTVVQALELDKHAFVAAPPRVAFAFSEVVREGKSLTLSGIEAYQSLVLPLVKAGLSLADQEAPVGTAVYFDLGLPICVAVLDAPMLFVTVKEGSVLHDLVPWVRVYRHDIDPAARHRYERSRLHAIDCVHKAWLAEYLNRHLLPLLRSLVSGACVTTRRSPQAEVSQRDHQVVVGVKLPGLKCGGLGRGWTCA